MRAAAIALMLVALAACAQDAEPARPVVAAATTVAVPPRSRVDANRDDIIKSIVRRRIAELDRAYRAVHVEAWQGRVMLMGAVVKPEQRRKAEQAAKSVEGVGTVLNELVVAEDKALGIFADDPARAAQVSRAIGTEAIVVRVVGGVAFLLGAVSSPDQVLQIKADALDVDGIKWAVAHLMVP